MVKRKFGFTVLELLIAIGIFALISASLIVNFRAGEKLSNLNFGSQSVAQEIRRMQAMALGAKSVPGYGIPGGYGARFESASNTRYILYADKNNDKIYTDATELLDGGIVNLPYGVIINSYAPSGASIDIVYTTGNGLIFINGAQMALEARVVLEHPGLGKTKTIIISLLSGLVKTQ